MNLTPQEEAGLVSKGATVQPHGVRIAPEAAPSPPSNVSEESFQKQVIALAHWFGYKVAHFRRVRVQRKNGEVYYETPVQADGKGWLDLVLVRERVIHAELKSQKGRLSKEQKEWIRWLEEAGQKCYVWRPSDMKEIVFTLRGSKQ